MLIGKAWKIESDALNVNLYRKYRSKKGEDSWAILGHFGTVENALVELINQGVRDTQLTDLKTICDKIEQLKDEIKAQEGQ